MKGYHGSENVMPSQPQRRGIWGRVTAHHTRFFAEFILSEAEGLRMTLENS
jgi:hypothetical protein